MRRRVEVDLSLANMGLDLIGQATHFLNAAGAAKGKGRDGDALAFHRDVLDFRNCWLVEQPNGDFAQTMARQFLFSTWQEMLFGHLDGSTDETDRRGRRQGGQGSRLSCRARRRMGDPARRRHRGEPAADGGRARLDLALRPRAVRDGRGRRRGRRSAASAPTSPPSAPIMTPASRAVLAEATLEAPAGPAPDPRRPPRPS